MNLSQTITPVLHRNDGADPFTQVLAVLCAVKTDRTATRDYLRRYAGARIASLVSDDDKWDRLVKTASRHLSSSPSARRRDIARRAISHVLRDYPEATPSQRRKVRLLAAVVGADMLANTAAWDTWVGNARNLAARLGIDRDTARDWLTLACEHGVLQRRGKTRSGEPRFALRRWPTSHKPSAVERAASASILAGEPNLIAHWVLSAAHPAWHFDRVKGVPNPQALTPLAWEASALWAAGGAKPTKRLQALLPADPSDLDLRWEAVARAEAAWTLRQAEATLTATSRIARREEKTLVYDTIAAWGWTPKEWPRGSSDAVRTTRLAALDHFIPTAKAGLAGLLNAPPALRTAVEQGLRQQFPAEAEKAIAYLYPREDIFDDNYTLVHGHG
ncbi:hypothetical protein AB1K56_03310 [Microbacterium sp. BWR-S6Y]|uniref:hypothetical protein n=1 Tax=Microbacterium sp. BWR-S6Y TaxID=3232073 RepID=UPI003527E386